MVYGAGPHFASERLAHPATTLATCLSRTSRKPASLAVTGLPLAGDTEELVVAFLGD